MSQGGYKVLHKIHDPCVVILLFLFVCFLVVPFTLSLVSSIVMVLVPQFVPVDCYTV